MGKIFPNSTTQYNTTSSLADKKPTPKVIFRMIIPTNKGLGEYTFSLIIILCLILPFAFISIRMVSVKFGVTTVSSALIASIMSAFILVTYLLLTKDHE